MNPRVRVIVIAAAVFAAVGALVWFLSAYYSSSPVTPVALPTPAGSPQGQSTPEGPAASPSAADPRSSETQPPPSATPDDSPAWPPAEGWTAPTTPAPTPPPQRAEPPANRAAQPPSAAPQQTSDLLIPVEGIRPEQLTDTFTQSRSEGRAHNALDIIAPRGTPVLAAADGRVVKLFNSVKGGITLYQLGTDEKTIYYYAHLDRYADNIKEGQILRRGETLGYVGDTGNSGAGNYHLHFAMWLVNDPKRYWDGANLNPYPLLVKR